MEIADHLRAQPGQDRGRKRSARNVDASRKERGPAQLIGKSGQRRHAKNSIKSRKRRITQKADKFSPPHVGPSRTATVSGVMGGA
jgi:hypothetical protein